MTDARRVRRALGLSHSHLHGNSLRSASGRGPPEANRQGRVTGIGLAPIVATRRDLYLAVELSHRREHLSSLGEREAGPETCVGSGAEQQAAKPRVDGTFDVEPRAVQEVSVLPHNSAEHDQGARSSPEADPAYLAIRRHGAQHDVGRGDHAKPLVNRPVEEVGAVAQFDHLARIDEQCKHPR